MIALYFEFETVPSSEDKAYCPMTQQNASGGDQTRDLLISSGQLRSSCLVLISILTDDKFLLYKYKCGFRLSSRAITTMSG